MHTIGNTATESLKDRILSASDMQDVTVYLDIGTCTQRLDSITYSSVSVLPGQFLVRTFIYTQVGAKYIRTGSNWSIV